MTFSTGDNNVKTDNYVTTMIGHLVNSHLLQTVEQQSEVDFKTRKASYVVLN